jgi:hypothetical protein
MVQAFILLRLVPGLEADALTQIRTVPGVAELTLVFGGWDARQGDDGPPRGRRPRTGHYVDYPLRERSILGTCTALHSRSSGSPTDMCTS